MKNWTGKTAIVTGSSRGLGLNIAVLLLEKGMDVIITSRSEDGVEKAKSELLSMNLPGKVHGRVVNFNDGQNVLEFANQCLDQYGSIDVVVNNVGMYAEDQADEDIEENMQKLLNVNLMSALRMNQALLPSMKQAEKGILIHTISIAARDLRGDAASYSISKLALKGYTDLLRNKLRPYNIKVCSLFPGAMNTSSWDGVDIDHSKLVQMSDMRSILEVLLSTSSNTVIEEVTINTVQGF